MENPLQHIVLTDEQDQIENFKMQLQAMLPNLYSFSFFFFDTTKLGQAIKDFVKTELISAGYESAWYKNPKGEILNEILTKDFSKKIAVWYFDETPENTQLINNINGKRDFLINNAQKLVIISTNGLYQSWFRDAYDFVSRAFGGIYRYHDVTQYFVNEIPQMPEREMKLARIRKEVEELKMLRMNERVAGRLLNLAWEVVYLSDFPLIIEIVEPLISLDLPYVKAIALEKKAIAFMSLGNEKKAVDILKEQQIILLKMNLNVELSRNYGNLITAYLALKEFNEALKLIDLEGELKMKYGDKTDIAKYYGRKAGLLLQINNLNEALVFAKKQENIASEIGDKNVLATSFSIQAYIYLQLEMPLKSIEYYKKEQQICVEIGNKQKLMICFFNQSQVLFSNLNQKKAGMILLKQALIMAKEIQNKSHIELIETLLKEYENQ